MVRKPPSFWRLDIGVFRIGQNIGDVNDLAFEQRSPDSRAPVDTSGVR